MHALSMISELARTCLRPAPISLRAHLTRLDKIGPQGYRVSPGPKPDPGSSARAAAPAQEQIVEALRADSD
eukprot:5480441-Pyramimonas_sp.AAC.1